MSAEGHGDLADPTELAALYERIAETLAEADPQEKVRRTEALWVGLAGAALDQGAPALDRCPLDPVAASVPPPTSPLAPAAGRPARPRLVPPKALPQRGLSTREGHAALIHSLVHIEFTAINLALDHAFRFRGLPPAYLADWLRVAVEEARHFTALGAHLGTLGHGYGDFDAHGGLWEMAERSGAALDLRMAVVPCTLEARGLDATPGIMDRLAEIGDEGGIACLRVILAEEIGHVAAGRRWLHYACGRLGVDPAARYREILGEVLRGRGPRPPFNEAARLAAGFLPEEIAWLAQAAAGGAFRSTAEEV